MWLPGFNLNNHPLPTPDTLPASFVERIIRVPNDTKWAALINGVLSLLMYEEFWVEKGSSSVEDTTQYFSQMFVDYVESEPEMGVPIGAIVWMATTTGLEDWLHCVGGVYNRVDWPLLYAALDPVYIIDPDTFTLPDLHSRSIIGDGRGSLPDRDIGDTGGETEVTLTYNEMPAHQHNLQVRENATPQGATMLAANGGAIWYTATGTAGASEPHENMQPFHVLRPFIRGK